VIAALTRRDTERAFERRDDLVRGHLALCRGSSGYSEAGSDGQRNRGGKGLYDGLALDGSNSNAALARLLDLPVILVLDTRGQTRGIAPLILGYQAFDPDIRIAGVILNRLGGSRHEAKLRAVVEHYTDVPVLGGVHEDAQLAVVERHLGLMPANEAAQADRDWAQVADESATWVMRPLSSRGLWAKQQPFGNPIPNRWDGPIAAITRGRIKPRMWRTFWSSVPPVALDVKEGGGLTFAMGIGEAPVGLQGAFSTWSDGRALSSFAHRRPAHPVTAPDLPPPTPILAA